MLFRSGINLWWSNESAVEAVQVVGQGVGDAVLPVGFVEPTTVASVGLEGRYHCGEGPFSTCATLQPPVGDTILAAIWGSSRLECRRGYRSPCAGSRYAH